MNKYIKIAQLYKNIPVEIINPDSLSEGCRWNGVDLKFNDGSYFQISLEDNPDMRFKYFDADLYEFDIPEEIRGAMEKIFYEK